MPRWFTWLVVVVVVVKVVVGVDCVKIVSQM